MYLLMYCMYICALCINVLYAYIKFSLPWRKIMVTSGVIVSYWECMKWSDSFKILMNIQQINNTLKMIVRGQKGTDNIFAIFPSLGSCLQLTDIWSKLAIVAHFLWGHYGSVSTVFREGGVFLPELIVLSGILKLL